jgi:hypothetical protein
MKVVRKMMLSIDGLLPGRQEAPCSSSPCIIDFGQQAPESLFQKLV